MYGCFIRVALAAAVMDLAVVSDRDGVRACILCKVVDGHRLDLLATNLDIAVARSLPVSVDRGASYSWLVPAQQLHAVLRADWSGEVAFGPRKDGGAWLYLESGKVLLPGPDVDDYPDVPLPDPATSPTGRIEAERLRGMLSDCLVAVGRTGNPAIDGVLLEYIVANDKLVTVGTDGHRIVVRGDWTLGEVVRAPLQAVIRPLAVRAIIAMCGLVADHEQAPKLNLLIEDERVSVWVDDSAVVTRVIAGAYPEYRRILLDPGPMPSVKVRRERLVRALEVLAAGLDDPSVVLSAGDDAMVLSTPNDIEGAGDMVIPAAIAGEIEDVRLSIPLLRDLARFRDDQEITVRVNGPELPVVYVDYDCYHAVMPMEMR